jgi:hypothetical protein
VTEKLMLLADGKVGSAIPVPCKAATVTEPPAGQLAEPLAPVQLTLVHESPVTAGSRKIDPSASDGPSLPSVML